MDFSSASKFFYGVCDWCAHLRHVNYISCGPALAPGERSHPDPNTSSGRLIWTLMRMFPKDFTASSSPAAKLTLWVYPNPELQNK